MDLFNIEAAVESIIFASGEPVEIKRIAAALDEDPVEISMAVDRIAVRMNTPESGIRLVRLDSSVQFCSAPEYADIVRSALEERKPPKLSRSALEALAIVAYYQPVTKAVIEQIRGVDSDYTVKVLLDRGFIEKQGCLAVPGRPVLYGTTRDFLRVFGISSVNELPELPGIVKNPESQAKLDSVLEQIRAAETADNAATELTPEAGEETDETEGQ